MTDLRQRLLEAFAIEYQEHLVAIREITKSLQADDDGAASVDVTEIYRRLHSLKGAARATDLKPVETLAHRLESLMSDVQSGKTALTGSIGHLVNTSLDAVEDWFSAYSEGSELPSIEAAIAAVDAAANGTHAEKEATPVPVEAGNGKIELRSVEDNSKRIEQPAESRTQAEAIGSPVSTRAALRDSVRVDVQSLDRLLKCAGELLVTSGNFSQTGKDAASLAGLIEELKRDAESYQLRVSDSVDSAARRGGDDLRLIHDFVLKLRTLSSTFRDYSSRQRNFAWRALQLSRSLKDEVQAVRMVPAETVFGAYRKMVRDIARDDGKEIEFHLSGADTRADRMVLQELKDPLLHILRNAVGHGIEAPEDRVASGKPACGNILVDISARSGRLEIRIEDDGRGLDLTKIESTARAAGLLDGTTRGFSDYQEIQSILFRSGFSTASSVNEIAGRGIGMSVVHSAVVRLQGRLELARADSGGLAVSISVPLSVATTRVLIVQTNDARYAFPTNSLERLYRMDRSELENVDGKSVFLPAGHDEAIRVASLGRIVGDEAAVTVDNGQITLVIVGSGAGRFAVAVDDVLAVRDAVVEPLDQVLPANDYVAGTILLEDGGVIPLLNPSGLLERFSDVTLHTRVESEALPKTDSTPLILVVDDSITTRTLEKSILESNGYRVRLSVDGLDALEQLRITPVDLVISDIEMPRMGGFDLVREIKTDKALKDIPVVLVTSRDSDDDRRRGLSLGADAYVVKQRFDQTNLIDTIVQLI